MKKLTLLLALLLLLGGCGVEDTQPDASPSTTPVADESPAPTQDAAPSASPAASAAPSPTESAAPIESAAPSATPTPAVTEPGEVRFETENVWLADNFGREGYALLFTGPTEDGRLGFAMYCGLLWDDCEDVGDMRQAIDAWSFRGSGMLEDGVCEFTASAGTVAITGRLTFEDGAAGVEYLTASSSDFDFSEPDDPTIRCEAVGVLDISHTLRLPVSFSERGLDEAEELWYGLPYFAEETGLPVARRSESWEITEKLGDPESVRMNDPEWSFDYGHTQLSGYAWRGEEGDFGYTLTHVRSSDPELAPSVRGITIGSTADEVLARFPNRSGSFEDLKAAIGDYEVVIYGSGQAFINDYASFRLCSEGEDAYAYIQVFEGGEFVRFYLDDSGIVTSISWSQAD